MDKWFGRLRPRAAKAKGDRSASDRLLQPHAIETLSGFQKSWAQRISIKSKRRSEPLKKKRYTLVLTKVSTKDPRPTTLNRDVQTSFPELRVLGTAPKGR